MSRKITSVLISFPEPVELTRDEEKALDAIAAAACKRYEAANPARVMWPAGFGSRPVNLWSAETDADIEFDASCLSIDCAERERYEWPCAKCGHVQGDHKTCITDPPAGDCDYDPIARA